MSTADRVATCLTSRQQPSHPNRSTCHNQGSQPLGVVSHRRYYVPVCPELSYAKRNGERQLDEGLDDRR